MEILSHDSPDPATPDLFHGSYATDDTSSVEGQCYIKLSLELSGWFKLELSGWFKLDTWKKVSLCTVTLSIA